MRRKDREIADFEGIVKIIDGCDILRIGLSDGDAPYIVPVNFGYTADGGQICFFVHGAAAGRKYELMKRNGVCSFEADIPLKMETTKGRSVTMRYKSVMGRAEIVFLEGEEKERAMSEVIMARYELTKNFDYDRSALEHTAVAMLKVTEITAKANL